MKTKAELKAARDERSALRTLARLRGESEPSKNHHGYVVTSPTGSVSLKEIPVPTHESIAAASKFGKARGKPFVIVPASDFFRTSFGKTVQALTHKKLLRRDIPHKAIIVLTPEVEKARKPTALTNMLNRLKASAQERRLAAKAKADTPRPMTPADIIARQMRETGEALDATRNRLADHSYLQTAMTPPKNTKLQFASNNDLNSLYARQETSIRQSIDTASKFRWDKRRINKLVKSNTVVNILILFRAGKLPDSCRTRKIILKEINK